MLSVRRADVDDVSADFPVSVSSGELAAGVVAFPAGGPDVPANVCGMNPFRVGSKRHLE